MKSLIILGLISSLILGDRVAPPPRVKVQLETYTISVVQLNKSGLTDSSMHYILVNKGQNLCDEMDTVGHELFHAITKEIATDSIQTLHDFIYATSTPWIDLLRDNPDLVKYFLQPRPPCRSNGH